MSMDPNLPTVALVMEYPIGQHGGVEVLVRELISGLSRHWQVLLVSNDTPESLARSAVAEKLTAHHPWNPSGSYRTQATRLTSWLAAQNVNLVHFHLGGTYAMRTRSWKESPIPIVAASGIPCIATNHGAFALLDYCAPDRTLIERLAMLPVFWLGRLRTIQSLRAEITVSDNDLRNMRGWFPPSRSKFRRIYHSQLTGGEELFLDREPFILALGTIGRRKGQRYLVDAFLRVAGEFPDWRLVLAGRQDADVDEMNAIRALVEDSPHRNRVVLAGGVSHEEARRLVRTAGVFAMPSLAEGLGLSLQEALFGGAAVVASNVGGIRDMVIDGQTGLLAPAADPEALAAALRKLMNDAPLRASLGQAARDRITQLGMNRHEMINAHLDTYRVICEGNPVPNPAHPKIS